MKNLKDHYEFSADQDGFQVQKSQHWEAFYIDGGDVPHRTGHFHFLIEANKSIGNPLDFGRYGTDSFYKYQMGQLESRWGSYCRYPKKEYNLEPDHYYNGGVYSGVMSRDQSTALLIAAGMKKDYNRVLRMMATHACRLFLWTQKSRKFLSPNEGDSVWRMPDFTFLEFFALYLRGLPILGYLLYPLLMVCDLETLLGSIFRRYSKAGKSNDDVANHVSICLYGMLRIPTPVMYLANKINSFELMNNHQQMYWGTWRMQGFYAFMFEPLMKKYFGR